MNIAASLVDVQSKHTAFLSPELPRRRSPAVGPHLSPLERRPFVASAYIPWWISAVWMSLTLLTALVADASSARTWMLMTTIGIVPCVVLLRLWNDGPPPTVAEVLHATELRR